MLAKISYHKDQFKIFCAIILIVVLMFLSNYYIFYNSTRTIYQQERENNILTVKSMIKSFDEIFKEVNNLVYSLNGVPFNIFDSDEKNINYKNTFLFLREASKLKIPDYITDFVIYSGQSPVAVCSEGTRSFNELIGKRFKNGKHAVEYWKNFAATRHELIILPTEEYTEVLTNSQTIVHRYIAIVSNNILNNARMNIIVFIDTDKLLEYINSQNMMKGASLLVMDSEKKVLLSTDNNYMDDIPDNVYLKSNTQMSWIKGKYEYSYTKSEYNGCVYINKMPRGYDSILIMLKVNQIILVITILLSVILAFFLSIYLYKPIKSIIALIGNKDDSYKNGSYDEIFKNIKDIQKENLTIKSQLDVMEEDVRRSIFFKLVDDISSYSKLKNQIDRYFTVIFSSRRYIMVAFNFDYNGENGKKDNKSEILKVPDEMSVKIQRRLNERFDSSIVFYMERMMFIALVGINDPMERKDVIDRISIVSRELQEEVDYKVNGIAAVSRFYTKIEECKCALRDIKMCLAYRNIKTTQKVIDAEKPDFSCEIYFPPEYLEILLNHILNSNYEESMVLINKVIDTNIENNISCIKFRSILSYIFNNIINTMGLYGFERLEILKLEMQFYEKLDDIGSFEEIREFLRSIIEQIIEKIQLKKQSKLNKDFIMEYIHLHYNDELYLDKMAEITTTSAKYFSNYFKKTFGVNFVEYLNKVRMRHAKELLKDTDIPVSTVGERVGLPLSGTFTSTFKKYCGISPAEYRRDCKL